MRVAFVCAAAAVALSSNVVGGAVLTPSGGIPLQSSPSVQATLFTRIELAPQEEWQWVLPQAQNLGSWERVFFSGRFSDPNRQGRAWLTYVDGQGQTVATDWEILYGGGAFNYFAEVPLVPSELTLHVKNRCDAPAVIEDGLLIRVITPEPATVGLLALAFAGVAARRRARYWR